MTVILIARGQSATGTNTTQATGWQSPWINMGGANALGLFVDTLSASGSGATPTWNYQLWASMDGGASDAKFGVVVAIPGTIATGSRHSIQIPQLPFPQIRIEFIVRTGDANSKTAVFDATVNTATL